MLVNIITRHGPSNYGSILQSIATLKAIEKLGHKAEIIDYQRKDERGMGSILNALRKKKEWSGNPIKKLAYIAVRYPIEKLAEIKFDAFRKKNLAMTRRISDSKELSNLTPDMFLTGSDQVWGPIGADDYDGAYFLDFADGVRRGSYAGSFGKTRFTDEIEHKYAEMLRQYDSLTVREDAAVKMIKDWGLPEPKQVLDPTLLLNKDEWSDLITEADSAPEGEYILVYQLHNNPKLNEYATALSRKLNLPVYRMSPYLHQIKRCGKFVWLPSLGKFLSMIKNAKLLVTDSFHGTAFAINLNTQFVDILPTNGTSSRNQSILQLTGLTDRIITDENDFETPLKIIDYAPVNRIIDEARKESMKALDEMLQPA